MVKVGQIVTYYPAFEEFGKTKEALLPRAAKVLELTQGGGVDPSVEMVVLQISGPNPGEGPFTTRHHVPKASQVRGCYDESDNYKAQGDLTPQAFVTSRGLAGAVDPVVSRLEKELEASRMEVLELREENLNNRSLLEKLSARMDELETRPVTKPE